MKELTEILIVPFLDSLKEFNKKDYAFRLLGVEEDRLIIKGHFYKSKSYQKAKENLPESPEVVGLLKKAVAYREVMSEALNDYMIVLMRKLSKYRNIPSF